MELDIRDETPDDIAAIRELNRRAFGQDQEAAIVDALRTRRVAVLSLVGTLEGRVVGHVMYSPVTAGGTGGAALGPMAVDPEHQRRGIGTRLVEAGNTRVREAGYAFIVVLGHPGFYPRFGFRPARAHGITCAWDVPDAAFMVLVLDPSRMDGVSGLARYPEEFSSVEQPDAGRR